MKKYFAFMLCLTLVLTLVTGCNSSGKGTEAAVNDASNTGGTQKTDVSNSGKTQEPIVLKMGHAVAESNPYHLSSVHFADLVYQKTNGRYKIDVYPNGTLGFERDLIEGVQMGSIDFSCTAATPLGAFVPEMMVADLPYLIRDNDHADKVYQGEVGRELLDKIDTHGFKALSFFDVGFRILVNNKRPVNSVKDVAGIKIRVMENKLYLELWRAMGADSVPMAWGEAFTALQQGAIDAVEVTNVQVTTLGVLEIAKNYAETSHVYTPGVYLMSQKLWNSLSAEDRKIFQECATETALYNNEINRKLDSEALLQIKDKGIPMTYPDKEELKKATQVVYDAHREFAEMVEKIRAVK